jgi:hypothetical protein
LVWVVSIAGIGLLYFKGAAAPGEDGRIVLQINKDEKRFVLSEMRGMLETVQNIVIALEDDDKAAIGEAVKGKGVADMMRNTPKILIAKVPLEFMTLGRSMHQNFDDIGKAAADGAEKNKIISMLGDQLGKCVACHSTYQLP